MNATLTEILRWRALGRVLSAAAIPMIASICPASADAVADLRAAKAIRLNVEQIYVYRERASITPKTIERLELPLAEVAEELLFSAGVVVSEGPDTAGATLTITSQGEALGGLLFGELEGYLYTGALVRGTIVFAVDGKAAYSAAYTGRVERRRSLEVNLGYERPDHAPFVESLSAAGSYYDRIAEAIGKVYGAPSLIVALDEADAKLRPFIARVLGDLGDRSAVPALVDVLADPDRDVRWQAAWSLGRLGDPLAVEPLIAILGDRDQDVRWFSAWSLTEITGQPFGDDATAWQAWWSAHASE